MTNILDQKPRTAPHCVEKVVWRVTQDPMSSQANDKVIVCEIFRDDKLARTDRYHMVPVRASDLSDKGCTLSQALKVATERKFTVVPEFLASVVENEIGFSIPSAEPVVVAASWGGDICRLTEVFKTPLIWNANIRIGYTASGDEEFGPQAVFIFLARA